MSFSAYLRRIEALLRRCKKRGLPAWAKEHSDRQLAYARHIRLHAGDKAAPKDVRSHCLSRAFTVLSSLDDMLRSHLRSQP